jgi:hypothetical protein
LTTFRSSSSVSQACQAIPTPDQATAPARNNAAAPATVVDGQGAMGFPLKLVIVVLVTLAALAAWIVLAARRNRVGVRRSDRQ